jgi:molybdate transport system substrate-binding protein
MTLSPAHADNPKLVVFAASSLGQTFADLGKKFENTHPGVSIQFSFLSSATLATQLLAGAPADLFASASESDMARVNQIVLSSKFLASNRIVLGVPKIGQAGKSRINKLTDLNRSNLKWIQCVHSAPCGVATDRALGVYGKIDSKPVSLEANVSSVVSKLINGEVDAAFIYHTDYVAHASALREIRFSDTPSTETHYQIGVLKVSKHPTEAQRFMDYLLSAHGIGVLSRAGFSR